MFNIDQKATIADIRGKNLVKAFFSMNNHQVATPEMMLEDARSYILFFRESGGKLSAYIGLKLLATGRKLFYSHSSNPFPEGETAAIEDEALVFVEGLGALLDEKDFTQLTAEEKKQWMDNQEIFIEQAPQARSEEDQHKEEQPAEEKHEEPAPVQQEPQASHFPSLMSILPVSPEPPQPVPPIQYQPPQTPPVPPVQYQPQPSPPQPAPPIQYQPVQPPPVQYTPPQQPVPVPPAQYQQQPSPASTSPQQPAPYVQPTFEPQKEQTVAPQRQYNEALPTQPKPVSGQSGQSAVLPEAEEAVEKSVRPLPKNRQEIMQKAIKAGVVKAPKQQHRESPAVNGVVSRDREALARLLTSF